MKQTYEKYSNKGLVIVGVSDEGRSALEKFVAEHSIKHPVVHAPGAADAFGISGYPTYYLIGVDGKILSEGHPSDADIESALQRVRLELTVPADSTKLKPLAKAWSDQKRPEFARLLNLLAEDSTLREDEVAAVTEAKHRYTAELEMTAAEIERLAEGPDYLEARQRLVEIEKDFAGTEVKAKAEAVLKRFASDATIKKELAALRQLEGTRARFDPRKDSDRRKLVDAMREFSKRHKGTHAAAKAEQILSNLNK